MCDCDVCNQQNLKLIESMKQKHGTVYLGKFNIYDRDKRKSVVDGSGAVLEEYTGQRIYNFYCDFCIPVADEVLAAMIREWNRSSPVELVEKMVNRVEEVSGVLLRWC